MKNTFIDGREMIRGVAQCSDLVYVISKGKSLIEQDISHSSLIAVDQGKWADVAITDWDSTAISIARLPSEKAVLIGEDGDVLTYFGGVSTLEVIFPKPVMIRNAKNIDGYVFVCGMKRQFYKRIDEGVWKDLSVPFSSSDKKVGFESIDGFSENEIYAVGWGGEIWSYDGSNWENKYSPTNKILTSICCAENGDSYICGQQGIMIKGRKDAWDIINFESDVSVDFWDLCWFQGQLYVASINNLFTLNGNKLVEVNFEELEIPTCYNLTTANDVLWSVGKDDVVSFNGKAWRKY